MLLNFTKNGLLILFIVFNGLSFGQVSKLQVKGEQFLKKEKYEEAITYFSGLDQKIKDEDPLYNYYIGLCYYKTPDKKESSIVFFEEYLKESDSTKRDYLDHEHVYYILGKMYHLTYEFEKAKEKYNEYIALVQTKPVLSDEEKEEIVASVNREIEQCNYGEIAILNPRNVIIENLGDKINTKYPDYAAVVSQDESTLIFTSRRPDTEGGRYISGEGFFEDVYQAELVKGNMSEEKLNTKDSSGSEHYALITEFEYINFKRMGENFNTAGHDAGIQLGADDKVLYFYRDADIWEIDLDQVESKEPQKMGGNVNSKEQESSIFFSYDGTKLFIASNREGGYGGLDIYVSEKQSDGTWGVAKNLGPNINTKFDEDAPYFDLDGKTLFFSSAGNSSIGGYDIFRSQLEDTTWSFPINLGYPINTTSDDIYFTMTSRYNSGYYSSGKLGGKGDMDLYRITFADKRDPVAELVGIVKLSDDLLPNRTMITMTSIDEKETISKQADSTSGDYFLLLGHGKEYDMSIETEGFAPFQRRFQIPEQDKYFQLYQEVHQEKLYNSSGKLIGQKITVYNAMGEASSSSVLYDSTTLRMLNTIKLDNNIEGNMEALTDVKFYMSEDSLKKLMEEDDNLMFTFDANTNVSFVNADGDLQNPDDYKVYNMSLNREEFLKKGLKIQDGSSFEVAKAENVQNIGGLFYTVQIGVYANPVTPDILLNIQPLNSQITEKGYIRYTSGKFASIPDAEVKMQKMIETGVADAYITAYYNGKRIGIADSKALLEKEGEAILFDKK